MKYPKHMGPETQAAELAWLYGSLAAAWSLVAQYQEMERRIDEDRDKAIQRRIREFEQAEKRVPEPEKPYSNEDPEGASGGGKC